MQSYHWQMRLYAFLYRRCFGVAPQEAVLYFMGELAGRKHLQTRPPKAMVTLPATEHDDAATLTWLRKALAKEDECRRLARWDPPTADDVPRRMCKTCLSRWSCPSFGEPFPWNKRQGDARQGDDLDGYDP